MSGRIHTDQIGGRYRGVRYQTYSGDNRPTGRYQTYPTGRYQANSHGQYQADASGRYNTPASGRYPCSNTTAFQLPNPAKVKKEVEAMMASFGLKLFPVGESPASSASSQEKTQDKTLPVKTSPADQHSNNPQSPYNTQSHYTNPNSPYTNPNSPYTNPNSPYTNPNSPYTNPNSPYTNPQSPYTNPNSPYNPQSPYTNPHSPYNPQSYQNSPYTSPAGQPETPESGEVPKTPMSQVPKTSIPTQQLPLVKTEPGEMTNIISQEPYTANYLTAR
jgi:hypothetical protein